MPNIAYRDDPTPLRSLEEYAQIRECTSADELAACYQSIKQQAAPNAVLLILDNATQCDYTSGHARNSYDLEDPDLEFDDPNYQLLDLRYCQQVLAKADISQYRQGISEKTAGYTKQDWQALISINQNLIPVLDLPMQVKVAALSNQADKLAIMPNGYFTCDFSPFENYGLIKLLTEKYAYEFIGLGASLLGFIKTEQFDIACLDVLIADLTELYHLPAVIAATLADHIRHQPCLFLLYTECANFD